MATVNPLLQQIDAIAKEKGVDPQIIIGAVQDALEAAARKKYKGEELRARFNPETGDFDLFTVKKIVADVADPLTEFSLAEAQQMYGDEAEVDMEVEFPRDKGDLGRIAAQTAKQVVLQRLREAERDVVFDRFASREGELISGTVNRVEPRAIILDVGNNVEAILATSEQSMVEHYRIGQNVKAYVLEVRRSTKGPQAAGRPVPAAPWRWRHRGRSLRRPRA